MFTQLQVLLLALSSLSLTHSAGPPSNFFLIYVGGGSALPALSTVPPAAPRPVSLPELTTSGVTRDDATEVRNRAPPPGLRVLIAPCRMLHIAPHLHSRVCGLAVRWGITALEQPQTTH